MTNRLDYIEDGNVKPGKSREAAASGDGSVAYPTMADYDFGSSGPRQGIQKDVWMYSEAAKIETRGERIKPRLIRIMWLLIRIAIGLGLVYFFLHGETFNCDGTNYIWT